MGVFFLSVFRTLARPDLGGRAGAGRCFRGARSAPGLRRGGAGHRLALSGFPGPRVRSGQTRGFTGALSRFRSRQAGSLSVTGVSVMSLQQAGVGSSLGVTGVSVMSLLAGVDDCCSESDVIIIPSALDFVSQDEMLTPLGRLDKYAASENIFNRQMVARSLLDTLREVCDDEGDCVAVLERIGRLADDSEPTVRAELMEQVPHIALFCQENRPSIPYAFSKYLLPIVVRYLADQNNQVRKTSQAALLALLEQELMERLDVETKVCPVLIELTAPDSNDDVKTEAVASMDATPHCVDEGADVIASDGLSPDEERRSKVQDVVPQALLDQYLSMTDPSRAQTVDTEIAKHCAYSLPGVALTLGRQNWHCLRETYETLASDMQWKVRRTLAFSIHELAVILGDQLTAADLVPIFNGFLKDLDEVRIGVLKHLHDFLKLLHIDKRREYLYQLQEFLVTDNSRNWRFRAELAEQLILLLELYSPRDVYDYLRPIALNLCADKVSSVRWISYKLVSEMVKKLHTATPPTFGVDLINELVENFGRCPRWSGRQAFVFVCQTVIEDDCLPMDEFAVHLMPHLLTLANDRVPNVRVLLAKTLRQTLLEKEYFLASASCHQEAVEQTIMALQMDRDSDVKYFASIHPSSTKASEDAMSTASSTY
ncbi:hypothetical protein NN561_019415 [Cricetulus griseus]